jgi:hypothetical protein
MEDTNQSEPSFLNRLGTAMSCFWRALSSPAFARQVALLLREPEKTAQPKVAELPPERVHASGLFVLAMLQREGRLIDFIQEDVATYSDADIGSAARVVHAGCRKVLAECLALEPVLKQAEGDSVSVPAGFDAQRIRLTGKVAGRPPFRGALKHHGWVTTAVRLPKVSETLDPRVLAPAEVELT